MEVALLAATSANHAIMAAVAPALLALTTPETCQIIALVTIASTIMAKSNA
jgi:hypothetical protein